MQPELAGACIEALVFEAFVCRGQRVSSVNVVYLKTRGIWNRLALDAGTVHWRKESGDPRPWAVPEEGWEYPHSDAGSEYKLLGAEIASLRTVQVRNGVAVELRMSDGRLAVFQNAEDHTSFMLASTAKASPST